MSDRDIAIAVFRVAAAGGLERHALRLAEALADRGSRVTIYTTEAGTPPPGVEIVVVKLRGLTNHGRLAAFAADFAAIARSHDLRVGFQKMPGLEVLFCCDWCLAHREIPPLVRVLPRYRGMAGMEAACFGPQSNTLLLMLAKPQADAYRKAYAVTESRMHILPPTLDRRRLIDRPEQAERAAWRQAQGILPDETAWLWVGLQPRVKGLDRAIQALALSPGTRLIVCGADPARRAMRAAVSLARRLGCAERLAVMGSVGDEMLSRLFLLADVLIHPARLDVTGTVIIEALAAGLPVVVTGNCGYAPHVRDAGAGVVVAADASPVDIAAAAAVPIETRRQWAAAARAYVATTDLTGGIAAAATIIETAADEISPRPAKRLATG